MLVASCFLLRLEFGYMVSRNPTGGCFSIIGLLLASYVRWCRVGQNFEVGGVGLMDVALR